MKRELESHGRWFLRQRSGKGQRNRMQVKVEGMTLLRYQQVRIPKHWLLRRQVMKGRWRQVEGVIVLQHQQMTWVVRRQCLGMKRQFDYTVEFEWCMNMDEEKCIKVIHIGIIGICRRNAWNTFIWLYLLYEPRYMGLIPFINQKIGPYFGVHFEIRLEPSTIYNILGLFHQDMNPNLFWVHTKQIWVQYYFGFIWKKLMNPNNVIICMGSFSKHN